MMEAVGTAHTTGGAFMTTQGILLTLVGRKEVGTNPRFNRRCVIDEVGSLQRARRPLDLSRELLMW